MWRETRRVKKSLTIQYDRVHRKSNHLRITGLARGSPYRAGMVRACLSTNAGLECGSRGHLEDEVLEQDLGFVGARAELGTDQHAVFFAPDVSGDAIP